MYGQSPKSTLTPSSSSWFALLWYISLKRVEPRSGFEPWDLHVVNVAFVVSSFINIEEKKQEKSLKQLKLNIMKYFTNNISSVNAEKGPPT